MEKMRILIIENDLDFANRLKEEIYTDFKNIDSSIEPNTPVPELAKKEAEELKNMDFQTAWTHTLKNAEFATSFVELLQEMLTGMDADDVIVSIDDLVDSVGGN